MVVAVGSRLVGGLPRWWCRLVVGRCTLVVSGLGRILAAVVVVGVVDNP